MHLCCVLGELYTSKSQCFPNIFKDPHTWTYFRCNMKTWKLESCYKHSNIWTAIGEAQKSPSGPGLLWCVYCLILWFWLSVGSWKVKKILYNDLMSTPFLCFMGLWHKSVCHIYCWCQITVLFLLYMQSTCNSQFPLPSCTSTCAEET